MPTKPAPSFRELDRKECETLLDRNNVGRIAFSLHDRVDIEPIHYVRDGDWLYIRTAPAGKLEKLSHNRWVAFEVDEVEGIFDWRSVVVRGSTYVVDPEGSPTEMTAFKRGVTLLRQVVPETFKKGDPVPFRNVLLRVHIDEVTGRAATRG
jgi:nitroimidazol reductase NimA-like FMN-containing flavoprotein (pyridoxamine 5'-phosphate oxidase superfamily)